MKTNVYKFLLSVLFLAFANPVLADFVSAAGKLQSLSSSRETRYEPNPWSPLVAMLLVIYLVICFYKWSKGKKVK